MNLPSLKLFWSRKVRQKAKHQAGKNGKTEVKGASGWKSTTLGLTGASKAIKAAVICQLSWGVAGTVKGSASR